MGPSITYKLRDAAGQARELHNYMLPVALGDGVPVFLFGMRRTPAEAFRSCGCPRERSGRPGWLSAPARRPGRRGPSAKGRCAELRAAGRRPRPARTRAAAPPPPPHARSVCLPVPTISPGKARRGPAGRLGIPGSQRAGGRAAARWRCAGAHPERRPVELRCRWTASAPARPRCRATTRPQAFMAQAVLALSDAFASAAAHGLSAARLQTGAGVGVPGNPIPGRVIVYLGCALLILAFPCSTSASAASGSGSVPGKRVRRRAWPCPATASPWTLTQVGKLQERLFGRDP